MVALQIRKITPWEFKIKDKRLLQLTGCELSQDKKETTWTFEEEEDDQDFLVHTLFLRHVSV